MPVMTIIKVMPNFGKPLMRYITPELQRRGTRVVRTISTTELLKETASLRAVGAKAGAKGYRQVAEKIKKEYVDAHNLDGLDVDMEVLHLERNWHSSRADVWRIRKIMAALSELLGPKADVNQGKRKMIPAINS